MCGSGGGGGGGGDDAVGDEGVVDFTGQDLEDEEFNEQFGFTSDTGGVSGTEGFQAQGIGETIGDFFSGIVSGRDAIGPGEFGVLGTLGSLAIGGLPGLAISTIGTVADIVTGRSGNVAGIDINGNVSGSLPSALGIDGNIGDALGITGPGSTNTGGGTQSTLGGPSFNTNDPVDSDGPDARASGQPRPRAGASTLGG